MSNAEVARDGLGAKGRSLRLAFVLTIAILAVETAGGFASHSLALLSDAGHVLTDVFAIGLAWFAVVQARRPADDRRSYGYHRVSLLAALVNSVTLLLIVIVIAYEAIFRLSHSEPVQGGLVVVTALIGIGVNSFIALRLHGDHHDMNLRAALIHVVGDLVASAGVVVAGIVILATGWLAIDSILSIGIALLIAFGAWKIVAETVNLLMEGTPSTVDLADVTQLLTSADRVESIHDLHVWALSSSDIALSCHVVIEDCSLGDAEHVVRELERGLCDTFGIGHTTIQVESCHPCGEIDHGMGIHNHPHSHVLVASSQVFTKPLSGEVDIGRHEGV